MINLLIGVSGAINAVSMPAYLQRLRATISDARVSVIMSASATRMIPKRTLSLYTDSIYDDVDALDWSAVNHVRLGNEADAMIVCPASAGRLGKLAQGAADDLLGATVLAFPGRLLIFPSMNTTMYANPAVKNNVALLRSFGHEVIEISREALEVCTGDIAHHPSLPQPSDWCTLVAGHARQQLKERIG